MTEIPLNGEGEIRGAFLGAGAVGPGAAQSGKRLGEGTRAFESLLRRGIIREAAPGTYYLYEVKQVPNRIGLRILIWIFVIVVPIAIIQFCPGHQATSGPPTVQP